MFETENHGYCAFTLGRQAHEKQKQTLSSILFIVIFLQNIFGKTSIGEKKHSGNMPNARHYASALFKNIFFQKKSQEDKLNYDIVELKKVYLLKAIRNLIVVNTFLVCKGKSPCIIQL